MNKKKVYYAHTIISYGSEIESQDIVTLMRLGFEVVNPNTKDFASKFMDFKIHSLNENSMEYFKIIIKSCDLLAFRTLPTGEILSGIAKEITYAQEFGLPIIELPSNIEYRSWDYKRTKQYLNELGHYKV